jgi:hypothetical protein
MYIITIFGGIMNSKKMVRLSNIIGFVSVLALIYWIIIFITMQVFGLRVFKEHATSTFYFSILGILALMLGTFMINIMFNLSRIAEREKNEEAVVQKSKKTIIFLASIPLVVGVLFLGDFISAKKMENELKKSADEIIRSYEQEINKISNYSFEKEWVNDVANMFKIIERIDKNFDNVYLIVADEINGNKMYLTFSNNTVNMDEKTIINKINYINKSTLEEREYLDKVFEKNYNEKYFVSKEGYYKLFIPYLNNKNKVILIFSNRQSYGTLSS